MQAVIGVTTGDRDCGIIPYFSFLSRITVLFLEQHCKHASRSLSNLFHQLVTKRSHKQRYQFNNNIYRIHPHSLRP